MAVLIAGHALIVTTIVLAHLDMTMSAASGTVPATPVSITSTSYSINGGFTSDVTLNCSLAPPLSNQFSQIISLFLSKTSSTSDSVYSEMSGLVFPTSGATSTSGSEGAVEVKSDLGADVKGNMAADGGAFISYTWDTATSQMAGNYKCEVFGVDATGHPVVSTATTVIEEKGLDLQMALEEVHKLTVKLNSTTSELDNVKANLSAQVGSCQDTLDSMTAQFRGHRYYVTKTMQRNITAAIEECGKMGGFVAEIDDKEEYDMVVSYLKDQNIFDNVPRVFIGAEDPNLTKAFTFINSGNPISFSNWEAHQPSPKDYPCVMINGPSYQMVSRKCVWTEKCATVCEIPH